MFGDAFQVLYTEVPQPLAVSHDPEINFGATSFSIQTNDSAFIAITLNDQILATGYGSANGPVSLTIPLISVGSQVKVTVTKHNYYRYSDLVPVTSPTLVANFAANNTSLCVGSSVDYSDMSSGDPTTWSWVFQGGTPGTSSVQNPTGITYNQPGNHDVTLTVTKPVGDPVTTTKTAYIQVTPMPVAEFQVSTGCPGTPLAFTDLTNPAGVTITSWTWNFGDPNSGTNNTSNDQNPAHTFNAPGTYQVSLEVKSNGICTNVKLKEVTINATPSASTTPQGETTLCKNAAGKVYTTAGVTGATSYYWLTEPSAAGTFTGTGTTGTLTLATGFTGSFNIQVQGANDCGNSIVSESLPVTVIEAPAAPAKPAGADSVDVNKSAQNDFTTSEVPGALSYAWSMSPETAGTITGSALTGSASWNSGYRGDVNVNVKAVNTCGESLDSDVKTLKLYSTLGLSHNNGLGLTIFPNPNDGKFSLEMVSGTIANVNLTVYNTLGVVVYAANNIKVYGKLHKSLDLSNLAKGVYQLKVEGNGISNTVSMIIAK
jgi:PKD repeat protein